MLAPTTTTAATVTSARADLPAPLVTFLELAFSPLLLLLTLFPISLAARNAIASRLALALVPVLAATEGLAVTAAMLVAAGVPFEGREAFAEFGAATKVPLKDGDVTLVT